MCSNSDMNVIVGGGHLDQLNQLVCLWSLFVVLSKALALIPFSSQCFFTKFQGVKGKLIKERERAANCGSPTKLL